MANKCLTCPKLISQADGAGGGTYKCQDYPGIVIGEWGHWVDDDEPTTICDLKKVESEGEK